ncbi:WD40 repeat-like protein [Suillus hirtellus]|nr:WD40 repeat-like protein [Suillus hirtellus]
MSEPNISTTPLREFKGHEERVRAVAVFPDNRRMVTASYDRTLRIWDLKKGVMLKKIEWHSGWVSALAVSRDGQLIASGDLHGVVTVWHGETGERLTGNVENYVRYTDYNRILSLDFSPDGKVLATGSTDKTLKLWCTETWELLLGSSIHFSDHVGHVRYSPSGELLAIAASKVEIYNSSTRERVAELEVYATSIVWTPDGTRLLSARVSTTVLEWDTLTWQQVGDPWTTGHTNYINALAVDPNGTLVASGASNDIRLWQLSDRQPVAIFQQSSASLTFSTDGKYILSGSYYTDNNSVTKWAVDPNALQEEGASYINEAVLLLFLIFLSVFSFGYFPVHFLRVRHLISRKDTLPKDPLDNKVTNNSQVSDSKACFDVSDSKIFPINTTAYKACIAGDLSTAEQLFTREINTDANSYASYANRSFVMARKCDWDHALQDAIEGIALYGRGHIQNARIAFDLASTYANEDSKIILLLVKAIAIFNADHHEESIIFVRELAATCPNHDSLACRVVEAYMRVQLGVNAMNDALPNYAADHFTAAVQSSALLSTSAIYPACDVFVVLFGWDLKSLWKNAHQKRCVALRQAGRLAEALNSYRDMMDKIDNNTKAGCLSWSNGKSEVHNVMQATILTCISLSFQGRMQRALP